MTVANKKTLVIALYILTIIINRYGGSKAQAMSCYQLVFSGTTHTDLGFDVAHIYQVDPETSGQKQLTDGLVTDSYPLWSPDGKHIAFVRMMLENSDDEDPHLFIMNPDGSNVHRLTDKTLSIEYFPVWSPDAQKLAFIGAQNDELAVYTIHADGTVLTRILLLKGKITALRDTLQGFAVTPALSFSRDGRRLHVNWAFDEPGRLVTIDLNSDTQTSLAFDGHDAQWSPDDRRIAYAEPGAGNSDIFLMNADGSGIKQLTTTGEDAFPAWSPDGHIIGFSSNRNGHGDFNDDIYLMGADGSHVTRLTSDEGNYENPIWSPDGEQLIFSSPTTNETYIIDSDKQRFHSLVHLTPDTGNPVSPAGAITIARHFSWSPSQCHLS